MGMIAGRSDGYDEPARLGLHPCWLLRRPGGHGGAASKLMTLRQGGRRAQARQILTRRLQSARPKASSVLAPILTKPAGVSHSSTKGQSRAWAPLPPRRARWLSTGASFC